MTIITYDHDTHTKQFEETFIIRPAIMDDAATMADLLNACNMELYGEAVMTEELQRREWDFPEFDLATSSLAFFTHEGQMIAYAEVLDFSSIPVRPRLWGEVHPDYRGRGIGTYLLTWAEKLAHRVFDKVPADARVIFTVGAERKNPYPRDLFEAHGYIATGQAWQKMLIELTDDMPQNPPAPAGLHWASMTDINDPRKVFTAHKEAFRDHRGFVDEDFEVAFTRWQHWMLDEKTYDPTLWYFLMDGDTIAGYSLNWLENEEKPEEGYVAQLGVVPAYRKRGAGKAVLLKAFHELWQRGKRKVSLFVDGSSLTGANQLYMGAGMQPVRFYETYEKEMRAGIEYSTQ